MELRLLKLWQSYTTAAGFLLLAAAVTFVTALSTLHRGSEVVRAIHGPKEGTVIYTYKGSINYEVVLERFDSCPGKLVTYIASKTTDGPPAIVTLERKLTSKDIISEDLRENIKLPSSVTPGSWAIRVYIVSTCPLYVHRDLITTFDIEVI